MSNLDHVNFAKTLSTTKWRELSHQDLDRIKEYTKSDGCTAALQIHTRCCLIHDWYYRTHIDFDGVPITRSDADKIFRLCMERKSKWWQSPLPWWRWAAVRVFGGSAWDK